MPDPLFQAWNTHYPSCGEPPSFTTQANQRYYGYFQNRFGEQWVFVYDHESKLGELRGGDIGWQTVVTVREGQADIVLGKAEAAWLQACWKAATDSG